MGKYISDETRLKQKRGSGFGEDYIPWIVDNDFNNQGVSAVIKDIKNGRMIQLMSQGELGWYYMYRFSDDVVDLREQFPLLPKEETDEIAAMFGARKPRRVMTTDMLLTLADSREVAISVKADRTAMDDKRNKEKFLIEQEYWRRRGVAWQIVFKEDLDPKVIENLEHVWSSWYEDRVYSERSLVRYMIMHKIITVDLTKDIDYRAILEGLKADPIWDEYKYLLEK